MYQKLDAGLIAATLTTLSERISERFPNASLVGVANELGRLATESTAAVEKIEKPRPLLRLAIGGVIVAAFAALGWLARAISRFGLTADAAGMIQALDAGFNIVVLTGGVLFYLVTLEQRL